MLPLQSQKFNKESTEKKIKTLVVEVQNCFNFEPLSKGGSVVATLSQQDIGGAFSLVYAFGTILDPVTDPQCRSG